MLPISPNVLVAMVSCELAGRHSYQLAPQEEHTMKPVGWRAPLLLKSLNHSEIRQNNWSYTRDKEQTQPFLLFLGWMLYGRKRWDFTMPAQLISFSVARRLHNYWQSTKETKKNQKGVTVTDLRLPISAYFLFSPCQLNFWYCDFLVLGAGVRRNSTLYLEVWTL